MKKILLIALAMGVGMASFAQKRNLNGPISRVTPIGIQQCVADQNQPATSISPLQPKTIVVAGDKGVTATRIGTSGNILTSQMNNLRCVAAYEDANMSVVAFTHRGGGSFGSDVNHQICAFSLDAGATFQSLTLTSDQNWANRYPSGVLYNPSGNTTPADIHLAYTGPFHLAGVWTGFYLNSEALNQNDSMYNYYHWDITPASIEPADLQSCTDGTVHTFTSYYKDSSITSTGNSYTIPYYNDVINGMQNGTQDTIMWSHVRISLPACEHSTVFPKGYLLFGSGQAWSEDGTIGYIYYFGVDSVNTYNNSSIPLVYKSTDKGLTWQKQPTFDFRTLPQIQDSIWPTHKDTSVYVPLITGYEYQYPATSGVVDANGQLHICTTICGEYSNYTDSVGYNYTNEPIKLYEIYTTAAGGWGANCITHINSLGVYYTDSQALPSTTTGANAIGWNHRIHTSRTTDGTKIFVTYMDEADTAGYSKLVLPNLFVKGWDVNTGKSTALKNYTGGSLVDGTITWMRTSNKVLTSGSTVYTIPVEFTVAGHYQEDTCAHYYLSGVTFNETDFLAGVNDVKGNINFVSQNYPNPFNGTTNISVSLGKASDIELSVINVLGDKVYQLNKSNVSAGEHNYTIDCSKLSSGIYFYTVRAGENMITHKMIIE